METPVRKFATEVVRRLQEAGFEALWAGGCVRDFLLDRKPDDFDVATSARPEQVRDLFGDRNTLAVGESFGVIIVKGGRRRGSVEVATFRREGPYSDGRRPDHVNYCSAEDDAKRRDFTINGMFFDPVSERVHDYVKGTRDLKDRCIRAIGNPADRMAEDKLRMLRAVRFTSTLDFELDPATADAVAAMASGIDCVSAERITQELQKMWDSPRRKRSLDLMIELKLLFQIFPELGSATEHLARICNAFDRLTEQTTFPVCLASVLLPIFVDPEGISDGTDTWPVARSEQVEKIARRLRLSNSQRQRTIHLLAGTGGLRVADQRDDAWCKRQLAEPGIVERIEYERAWAASLESDRWCRSIELVVERQRQWGPMQFNPPVLLTGQDLIQLGMSPGPVFRHILETVRDAQLNGEIEDRNAALQKARQLNPDKRTES